MIHPKEITGAVLAGGKSSRFGSNKALCKHDDSTFVELSIKLLSHYSQEVIIAGHYPEYENLGIRIFKDKYENIGPLGGIYTALEYAKTSWTLIVTCDMPLLINEIIMYMLASSKGENIISWKYQDRAMVFPLLISKAKLLDIEEAIQNKKYRMKEIIDVNDSLLLPIPDNWNNHFSNINTQEEYKEKI